MMAPADGTGPSYTKSCSNVKRQYYFLMEEIYNNQSKERRVGIMKSHHRMLWGRSQKHKGILGRGYEITRQMSCFYIILVFNLMS